MPKKQPNGRPSKSIPSVVLRPAVGMLSDSPPKASGISQADWEKMSPQAKFQVVKTHNPRAPIRPAAGRSLDDGQPSKTDPENLPAVSAPSFTPVITDSVEEMRDLNEPRVMEVALSIIADVAGGRANGDIFKQTIFRDFFKHSLERKREAGRTPATEARARLRQLKELEDRLLATDDAEFAEIVSCGCQPDPSAVESIGPATHFRRICRSCGHMWAGLRCVHDESQAPCPGCGIVPTPELIVEGE